MHSLRRGRQDLYLKTGGNGGFGTDLDSKPIGVRTLWEISKREGNRCSSLRALIQVHGMEKTLGIGTGAVEGIGQTCRSKWL